VIIYLILPLILIKIDSNDELADADLSVDNTGLIQNVEVLAVLSNDSDGDIEIKVCATEGRHRKMPAFINVYKLDLL